MRRITTVLVFAGAALSTWLCVAAWQYQHKRQNGNETIAFEPTPDQREWARQLGTQTRPSTPPVGVTRSTASGLRLLAVILNADRASSAQPDSSRYAVIAADGQPPRLIRAGTLVDAGLTLVEVAAKSVVIARLDTGERFALELADATPIASTSTRTSSQKVAVSRARSNLPTVVGTSAIKLSPE